MNAMDSASCILACPTNCLELEFETMRARVANIGECIVCKNCEEQCPLQIIKVRLED